MSNGDGAIPEAALGAITIELGRIARLMALESLERLDGQPQGERIRLLWNAGFTARETADLIGASSATVRSAHSRLRAERDTGS